MSRDTPVGYSSTVMHAAAAMIGPLQRRGSASTAYLAEAAGVAETTAHRSLRFLRECGAPLKFNRSKLAWTPKAARPIGFDLQFERVIAMLEELHADYWPRWLVHVIGLVRAGDPWITVEAGQVHPVCSFSIAIDRTYRSYCPIAAELISIGWAEA